MITIPNFVGGDWIEPDQDDWVEVVEPATGRPYARIPDSDAAQVDEAVTAARTAFESWSRTPAAERSRILLRIADAIHDRREELAQAESADTGKPVHLAQSLDIPRAEHNFRFFATAILHEASESHATDRTAINYTLRRPRGVAALISPWNLPLYLLSWKVAPALATGNTAVAKPSEVTPMTAHLLTEIAVAAGLPPGVLNVVHGRGPGAGARLVAHPDVAAVSFTGSTRAGAEIARVAGPGFKKLSLEMGGKNPNLIFADAELDEAVRGTLRSSFANQGEICLCGERVFVERPVYDEFLRRLVAGAEGMRVADPAEDDTDQGAIVSAEHLAKIEAYVALAREEGGRVLAGGTRPADLPPRCRDGFFFRPTVITELGPRCRTNQEEIFGPVVTVTPFDTEDEVLEWANGTPYGLSASVWTTDLSRAHRVADRLDCGTVWINCWLLRDLRVPFGGSKASGVGREGGVEALRFFTEPKNVCVKL